jgi:hypothetical protein
MNCMHGPEAGTHILYALSTRSHMVQWAPTAPIPGISIGL